MANYTTQLRAGILLKILFLYSFKHIKRKENNIKSNEKKSNVKKSKTPTNKKYI
jgi:hypothetical protein